MLDAPVDFLLFLLGVLATAGLVLLAFRLSGSKLSNAGDELPNADAYEFAWQELAEDSNLDPVTVAVCKRLRDREVEGK